MLKTKMMWRDFLAGLRSEASTFRLLFAKILCSKERTRLEKKPFKKRESRKTRVRTKRKKRLPSLIWMYWMILKIFCMGDSFLRGICVYFLPILTQDFLQQKIIAVMGLQEACLD